MGIDRLGGQRRCTACRPLPLPSQLPTRLFVAQLSPLRAPSPYPIHSILMWAGNNVTRPFRLAGAAALAPFVDRMMEKLQVGPVNCKWALLALSRGQMRLQFEGV